MSGPNDSLTDDEVRQITLLVETLDRSTFDFMQLELGNLKVTIGKGSPPSLGAQPATQPALASPASPPVQVAPSAAQAISPPLPAAQAPAVRHDAPALSPQAAHAQVAHVDDSAPEGTVTIVAPMMGRFYSRPEPGAQPFVAVGDEITADTTVALIEVMKVFTAVRAGVSGVITAICVQDAQLVEYEHVLFRVRLASRVSGSGHIEAAAAE